MSQQPRPAPPAARALLAPRYRELQHQISERAFQAMVIEAAGYLGWTHYHTWHSIHSPSGFVDLVLVRPPRVLMVELKSEHGRLTTEQTEWRGLLEQCPGVEYATWKPRDWDTAMDLLR